MPRSLMLRCCGATLLSFTLISPSVSAGDPPRILAQWDFDTPELPFQDVRMLETEVKDGVLHARVLGNDPELDFPPLGDGPLVIRARIRSSDGAFGRAEIFWKTDPEAPWDHNEVAMYPFIHDGEWREYAFPLPIVEGPVSIRMDTGWKPGLFEIDWIRIEEDPLPEEVTAGISSLPSEVRIADDALQVMFRPEPARLTIRDLRTAAPGREWTMDLSTTQLRVSDVQADGQSLLFSLFDPAEDLTYTSTARLEGGGILSFDLEGPDPEAYFWAGRTWPPTPDAELPHGAIVFADRSSGTLLRQDETLNYRGRDLEVYGNTDCSDMPWIGLFDEEAGDGIAILAETPADAFFALRANGDDKTRPQLRWRQSLDTFRYPRRMSFRFEPAGGYVALAKNYREYVRKQGRLKTLAEKAAERPNVRKLYGAAIVWGALDIEDFLAEARTEGLIHGAICNAHHGINKPAKIRAANGLGYLTAEYDSFSDIREGPTGFQSDSIEETAFHARPGLGPKGGWVTEDGFAYSDRSTAFALRALRAYVPEALGYWGFNSRFIDVSLAMSLLEDWHPEHTFDRRQDMAYRREAFAWLGEELGLVLGTEHGNDWGVDLVDFWEGSIGGPLHWRPQGNWASGFLRAPASAEEYIPEYLHFGLGYDVSVPLWQLVYQDCTVNTWYWGDGPGIHYSAAPWISDRKDLFTLLYAGVPLLWRDDVGYGWPENKDRFMQSVHDVVHVHRAVAESEMTSHRFLSSDSALQETRFADGTRIVVNFSDEPRVLEDAAVTLAPRGYHVRGPEILQELVMEDGISAKRIEADGFRLYERDEREEREGVSYAGHFRAFRMPEGHWQFVLTPGERYEIDPALLTGFAADHPVTLYALDKDGRKKQLLTAEYTSNGNLVIDGENSLRYAALEQAPPPGHVHIYPGGGEVSTYEPVLLSWAGDHDAIRYTLDGSAVSVTSSLYEDGVLLKESSRLRARAFRNGRAVGEEASADFSALKPLARSGVVAGGMDPVPLSAELQGIERLRLRLTTGGDNPWNDRFTLGDAVFVHENGSRIPLSDLKPVRIDLTYGTLVTGAGPEFEGRTAGRSFDSTLHMMTPAVLEYAVPRGAVRFEGFAGIDDAAARTTRYPGTADLFVEGLLPTAVPPHLSAGE